MAGAVTMTLAVTLLAALPANSEPRVQVASQNTVAAADDPYAPFTSNSPLEVISIGDGRARVGRANPLGKVRNPASPSIKKLPSQAQLDAAMQKALSGFVWTPKPDAIPEEVWREIDAVTDIAGAAPLIGRLPVNFDTFAVGKAYRDEVKLDKSIWQGSPFPYGSNDPAIAQAAIKVFNAISQNAELAQRSTDMGLAYGAVDVVRSSIPTANPSGAMVTGREAFAQLGVTPFVRVFATGTEARVLYEQGLLVDFMLDSAGDIDLSDTVEDIQADRYQYRWNLDRWRPALERAASGKFTTIAVLDSGVDVDGWGIPRNRRVDGVCFGGCDGASSPTEVVEGLAASNHCDLSVSRDCDHGTHVASIIGSAAGSLPDGTPVPSGVAPAAQIASYRVCMPLADSSGSTRPKCPASVAIQALGRSTSSAATLEIAAANLSFGTPNMYGTCPTRLRNRAFASAVGAASAAGISVIQANGNGSRFQWGACDPTMIVVANATKAGNPAASTDFHSTQTSLWAPGSQILAASVDDAGASNVEFKTGTSMAAPHVAGAMALIAQSVREYNGYGARPPADRVTLDGVRSLMLGIAPTDPARVMIADSRPGTDAAGSTSSGASAPLLSLRNLWMLLAGPRLSSLTTVPTYSVPSVSATAPVAPTLADLTPRTWTVTTENVRREYNGGAVPLRGRARAVSGVGVATVTSGTVRLPLGYGWNFLDGPFLVVYTRNGTVTEASDASGNALSIQRIARGPQPCTRAGWIETVRIPITEAQLQGNGDFRLTLEGPDPYAVIFEEATVASSSSTNAVATDPRPLVFGGSNTFPAPVNLGAHRPDIGNASTFVNWFDLDRITGDVLMINDAVYGAWYPSLSGTRVPNDAVAQNFFMSYQESLNLRPAGYGSVSDGVIGWDRTSGIQDCAVAMGHYWVSR